jgi:hypothetical protein
LNKVVTASCQNNTVTIEGQTVEAEILSQGKKSSQGAALIDKDKVVYITSNADDIKKVIEDVAALTQKVIEIATGLDSVSTSPGSQAANIVLLTTLKTQFELTKENLK